MVATVRTEQAVIVAVRIGVARYVDGGRARIALHAVR
jgi:hypothetical protein